MELLLVVLLVIVIAAAAFAAFGARRQRGAIASSRLRRGTPSPLPPPSRRARRHPMADAVQEHAQAMDPQEVVAAEQRLQAEAGRVASGLKADARRDEHARADAQVPDGGAYADASVDGYAAPGADPYREPGADAYREPAADPYREPGADPYPRDPRYGGRSAGNPVDPRDDPRYRPAR
jgi:hypothetical protein